MSRDEQDGGGSEPAPDARDAERQQIYREGRRARRLKEAGQLWVQPYYPAIDSDLAQAWLEGWEDMGDGLGTAGDEEGVS